MVDTRWLPIGIAVPRLGVWEPGAPPPTHKSVLAGSRERHGQAWGVVPPKKCGEKPPGASGYQTENFKGS